MDNIEFAKKLEIRTIMFAISIIKLSASLPGTIEGRVIRNQITKSGTSIGANYREANRSRSKMDWVKTQKLQPVHQEADELLAIFTSIGKKIKI